MKEFRDRPRPTMSDEEMVKDYPRLSREYALLHQDYRKAIRKPLNIPNVMQRIVLTQDWINEQKIQAVQDRKDGKDYWKTDNLYTEVDLVELLEAFALYNVVGRSEQLNYTKTDKLGKCLCCGDTDCCDDFCNG